MRIQEIVNINYIVLLLKSLMHDHITSKKELEFLSDYLFFQENWTGFELALFSNSIPGMNVSTVKLLQKNLVNKPHNFFKISSNRELVIKSIINSTLLFLEKEDYDFCNYLLNSLDLFIEKNRFYHKFIKLILKECINLRIRGLQFSDNLSRLQLVLKMLGDDILVIKIQNLINQKFPEQKEHSII